MDTPIQHYISLQPQDRQKLLSELHKIIIDNDAKIIPSVEPMMGKEMILYKGKQMMKYGLASVKGYISLHVLPMYMNTALHSKYKALLSNASFQKGCINFTSADQVPLKIVGQLIAESAKIDLEKIREQQLAGKKAAKKSKG